MTTSSLAPAPALYIRAAAPRTGPADITFVAPVEFQAAAPTGDAGGKAPTFVAHAYNGGPMRVEGWADPVVVDLSGLKLASKALPALRDHNRGQIVGHISKFDIGNAIAVSGVISGSGAAAKEVVDNHRNGFPWQMSIGARVESGGMEFVPEGTSVTVNGNSIAGPVIVARRSTLGEISFVALGADTGTSAQIAASEPTAPSGGGGDGALTMKFKEWVKAEFGLDVDTLADEAKAKFEAQFKKTTPTDGGNGKTPGAAAATTPGAGATPGAQPAPVAAAATTVQAAAVAVAAPAPEFRDIRAQASAEYTRIAAIQKACGDKHPAIAAKGIDEGWTGERVELEVLRAERPRSGQFLVAGAPVSNGLIEAAALLSVNADGQRLVKTYGEQTVEAASKLRGLGIQDLFRLCARAEGIELPLLTGSGSEFIRAAFSTLSLPGLLSNLANKLLLEGFNYVEPAWKEVAKLGQLKDFKPHYRFRLTSDLKFKPVGPNGELQHGSLGEIPYAIQGDTQGILFALTRKMIIDDDLGAFGDIPRQIGIGAADCLAEAVWTLLLDPADTTFFSAANKNLLQGTGTVLGVDGLNQAYAMFLAQTKPNGRPLGVRPNTLAVPVGLETTAQMLNTSQFLIATVTNRSTPTPAANPMQGKFAKVVSSAYLSNGTIPGNSTTAYYLFADPNMLAALEVGFLNGQQQPTVERAESNFNTLGIEFRGFIDFGAAKQEPRGALKVTGIAAPQ